MARSPPARSTRRRSTTCSTRSAAQGAFDKHGPLRVSSVDTVSRSMLVFGGPGVLRSRGYWPAYERLVDHSARQRGYGDYFGYTFVARGQAEAMIDVDLKPWDLAALKIIIEEAGGRFTDFSGRATAFGGSAIASNGLVHEEIRRLIDERRETQLGARYGFLCFHCRRSAGGGGARRWRPG